MDSMTSPTKDRSKDPETSSDRGYRKDFRTALPQILAVSVKNLLLLGYGMTLGFPTILIPAVKNPIGNEVLHLEKSEISWISSISFIVVPVGCALSGAVATLLGRRRAMQAVNLPFLVAWLIFHFSTTTVHLYAALFLTGLAGGLLEAPVLTYVAEITQPHLRGALSATSSTCIILGVFTQFLLGTFLYWRTIALINISLPVIAVITLCFVPESPHWLVSKQRYREARKSLQWLRGWTNGKAVEMELKDIQVLFDQNKGNSQEKISKSATETFSKYTERGFLIPFFLISYTFFVGHFSGMTTLQTYAVSIFQMLEAPMDKYFATLVLGLLQIFGSVACVMLVHCTGKRPLTLFSTAGAGFCCLLVAAYGGYIQTHDIHEYQNATNDNYKFNSSNVTTDAFISNRDNPYSWIPTTLLMMLAFITHTGIRLLPWILIGEVYNAQTRSGGAGLSGAVGYILGFLTNKMYITMVDNLSIWGTYGLYSIVCFTGFIVLYYILPETEGKKLNDIQNHFSGIRRLTNNVYRSTKLTDTNVTKKDQLNGNINPCYEEDCSKL